MVSTCGRACPGTGRCGPDDDVRQFPGLAARGDCLRTGSRCGAGTWTDLPGRSPLSHATFRAGPGRRDGSHGTVVATAGTAFSTAVFRPLLHDLDRTHLRG